ncbi:MAG: hypothetical protein SGBAC_005296 [Bacillariaceae sp.]
MTGVSWFNGKGNGDNDGDGYKSFSIKEAAQAMYPPKQGLVKASTAPQGRFSALLLEHGEQHIQDWAVIVYSSPLSSSSNPVFSNVSSPRHKKPPQTTWAQGNSLQSSANMPQKKNKSKKKKYDKDSYPSVHMTKIEGRLHLCSKSIVLEPNDISRPIVRISFAKMDEPPKEFPSSSLGTTTGDFDPMCIEFSSTKHTICKANNCIGAFEGVGCSTNFKVTFLHSSPTSCVNLCLQLFQILPAYKPGHGTSPELEDLLKPMLDRPFDPNNLYDVRERPLTSNLRCSLLTPLQQQRGCLVMTQERIYFQFAQGVLEGDSRAISWHPADIQAYARRYHGLKDSAVEIFWKDQTSTLLALERTHEREQVVRLLPNNVPCHTDREFLLRASQEWQKKTITNYDYLLLVNSAAGRTFQDLSRYPVFPWVIADYTSAKLDLTNESTFRDMTKPVGALNEKRLAYFQQRYESMQDMEDPFLYGTHYSAAGYVLYYLVRSMPEQMLCLQNGKFDAPDRMFHSLDHCYRCVLSNHADVKELIPEFYHPNNDFDFLINARGLQLGAMQTGDRVNDVSLPPWAKSPRHFLKMNSKALESDICTQMLPRWVDLIFGSKSRGVAAQEAHNLFHTSSYMGPSDLAELSTAEERFQAELQATEFGIVPDQLFIGPHPLRHETVDDSFVKPDIGRTSFSGTEEGKGEGAWELLETPSTNFMDQPDQDQQPEFLNPIPTNSSESDFQSEFRDRHHPFNDLYGTTGSGSSNPQSRSRKHDHPGIPLSGTGDLSEKSDRTGTGFGGIPPALSNASSFSAAPLSPTPTDHANARASASTEWDIKFIEKSRIHADTVSGCSMINGTGPNHQSILATTSLDGGLKIHNASLAAKQEEDPSKQQGITSTLSRFSYITMSRAAGNSSSQPKLSEFRSHTSRDALACLALISDGHGGKIAFAGGHDDVVFAYGITSGCAVASVYSHRDAVTGLDVIDRPSFVPESKLWRDQSTHIMVSGSWDATVKVWSVIVSNGETVSIDREPLAELFDADSSIVCVSSACVPQEESVVISAGCADGSFCVWKIHGDGVKVVIHKDQAKRGSGPCSVLKWSTMNGKLHLFTGFSTGKVASFTLKDGSMKKVSAASVGVAVQCLAYSENILLVGCSDGGLRLIPTREGAQFTTDLSLWPSVNNKSAPGLSCLSMSFVGTADGAGKCICCTGAEDGSVALFELKRAHR